MDFYQFLMEAAEPESNDYWIAKALERLPVGPFTYAEAVEHLQAQNAPGWAEQAVTLAHENWLAEQEEAKRRENGDVFP